ncbi:MAG: hypothetical protein HY662_02700 [Chloroflexi bacterium]|nr:hypothetical protein [Chloroflexota bacterium]
MPDLKTAITIVELIVAVAALLVMGDYLGYKAGRMRLFSVVAITSLVAVILFAIYAAITLL